MAQFSNAASSPAVTSTPGQQSGHDSKGAASAANGTPQDVNTPLSAGQAGGSAAAAAAAAAAANAQHKRVYQACIPCRRRKVRCDLGSVDNPHDPPCVRCRRESKECFFSATRRKRKTEDDGSDLEDYIIRNGRRKVQATSPTRYDRRSYAESPAAPAAASANWRSQPLRRPDGGRRDKRNGDFSDDEANQTLENLEAQSVIRQTIYGPHDALDLLYKAATDRSVPVSSGPSALLHAAKLTSPPPPSPAPNHRRDGSIVSASGAAPTSAASTTHQIPPPPQNRRHSSIREMPRQPSASARPAQVEHQTSDLTSHPAYAEAIKAWSRFRFVRAGWFTAQEAIEYID